MSEEQTGLNFTDFIKRIADAVVKRIEGGDDPRRKYDYLTKLDPDTVKSLSNLSEGQLDSIAESCFLGDAFPSLLPLKDFAVGLAMWSPSKAGKRADQLTATMISQETHVVPTVLSQMNEAGKKKDKGKEKE